MWFLGFFGGFLFTENVMERIFGNTPYPSPMFWRGFWSGTGNF
jgi:hypothetical protein